ncbi:MULTISPECIES: arginase family protein [unclassified Modestobacter]
MPAALRLLQVPYDSGRYDARMGAGPGVLSGAGAAERLRVRGHAVREEVVHPGSEWRAELRTGFELQRAVAVRAAEARAAGEHPVVLSGNCSATIGALAALTGGGERVGLVWLDAHGDLNTPDVDPRGFLDGQGLAMALGRCWTAATATVPGFAPLAADRVVLIGARDLDPAETDALRRSGPRWLPPRDARDARVTGAALVDLADRVDVVHLHVDLDVHDPSIAPANGFAAPDGLTAAEVQRVVGQTAERVRIGSATLAAYDPAHDPAGRMRETALELLTVVAGLLR